MNHNQHHYIHTVNAIWEFSKEMKRGDIVYVKKGQTDIVGWGVVSSNHQYKMIKYHSACLEGERKLEDSNQNIK